MIELDWVLCISDPCPVILYISIKHVISITCFPFLGNTEHVCPPTPPLS